MPKFKVIAVYFTYCTAEVEAENWDEAHDMAEELDGGDFTPSKENFDWHISDVQEIK
jgi:hypothetical protein